jgi:hypothetical protein
VIGPSIESRAIVEAWSIDIQIEAAVAVAAIEAGVLVTVVIVGPAAKIAAVVTVPALDIPRAASLGKEAAVTGPIHRDHAIAIQAVMHIHSAAGVMDVADPAIGSGANGAAVGGDMLVASAGRAGMKCRGAGIISDGSSGDCARVRADRATGISG